MHYSAYDFTGVRFGQLTVIEPTNKRYADGSIVWLCKCDCGKFKEFSSGNIQRAIKAKRKSSCGCMLGNPYSQDQRLTALHKFYLQYNRNALARSLTFNLTLAEFKTIIVQPCFYCGTVNNLVRIRIGSTVKAFKVNGLDRRDNILGYTVSNCVASCTICNMGKYTLNAQDYISHCKRVALYHENTTTVPTNGS